MTTVISRQEAFDRVMIDLAKYFSFCNRYMNEMGYSDQSWDEMIDLTNTKNKTYEKLYSRDIEEFARPILVLILSTIDSMQKKEKTEERERLYKDVKRIMNQSYKAGTEYLSSGDTERLTQKLSLLKSQAKGKEGETVYDSLFVFLTKGGVKC